MKPKNKRGVLFAGAVILSEGIGFYFYPLYLNPEFFTKMDCAIKAYWKEGSAFRISNLLSEVSMRQFTELLQEGWKFYKQNEWVK